MRHSHSHIHTYTHSLETSTHNKHMFSLSHIYTPAHTNTNKHLVIFHERALYNYNGFALAHSCSLSRPTCLMLGYVYVYHATN